MLAAPASRRAGRARPRGSPTATSVAATSTPKAAGRARRAVEHRLLHPDARRSAGSRQLDGRREREAVELIATRRRRRATAAGTASGASTSTAVTATSAASDERDHAQRREPARTRSDQRPAPIRPPIAEHLQHGEHRRGRAVERPRCRAGRAREAGDADLRREQESAANRDRQSGGHGAAPRCARRWPAPATRSRTQARRSRPRRGRRPQRSEAQADAACALDRRDRQRGRRSR